MVYTLGTYVVGESQRKLFAPPTLPPFPRRPAPRPTPHAYAAASWLPPSPAPGYRSHAHPDLLVLGVPVLSGLRGVYAWRRARSPRRWPRIPPVPIPYTTPRPRKQPHVDHVHGHPRGHAFQATCTKVARIPHARTRASPHARPVVRTCCVNKHV